MKIPTLLFVFGMLVLTGCGSTNTVTLDVREPASVLLPDHMTRVAIVDRTTGDRDHAWLERVDEFLSFKGEAFDRLGAEAGVAGLVEELTRGNRFEVVVEAEPYPERRPNRGVFPAPLKWDQVDAICEEYDVNGIFALEWYDTDTKVDYKTEKVKRKAPDGTEVEVLEHVAVVGTNIRTGWRIYDAQSRTIIDESEMRDVVVTRGRGVNPVEAVEAITGRTEAVQTVSRGIGRSYGHSVSPYWHRVARKYYVKGTDSFEIAKRRAQTGNWEGAAELWLAEVENPDPKIAGRAAYNMAIMSEIRGDLDAAIDWSRRAYEDFGDKLALSYVRLLQDRQERLAMAGME